MNRQTRVFIAGGGALCGAAILELIQEREWGTVVGAPPDEPDLANAGQVEDFFADARPEYVVMAAGMSGGIGLNRARPAEIMLDNLLATAHVLDAAHRYGVAKLLYLASSCAYPRRAPQPLRVESLTTGPLEPTSEAYATAKLAGWKLCEAYRRQYGARFVTAFPANPFGPHDDFGLDSGHVLPALIRRAHEAKLRDELVMTVWGTGAPRREFLYARDLADACLFVLSRYEEEAPINLGGGTDLSIAEAARAVAEVVGYKGRIEFDATKPDGAPLKRLDSTKLLSLGWRPSSDFRSAMTETYDWFLHHEIREDAEYAHQALPVALPHSPGGGGDRPRLRHG